LMSPVAAELLFLGVYFSFLANGRPRFTWPFYIILLEVSPHAKDCLDFSFVFSAPLPAWRNLSTGPSPTVNCLEVPLGVLKISTPMLWLQLGQFAYFGNNPLLILWWSLVQAWSIFFS
jgi:hypothetical protein